MRKVLSVLLALVLLLGCASGFAEAAGESGNVLPAVGDVIHGFEVREIRDFPLIGAKLVLFEHQKTGGQMLWIANEDTNRAFQLAFPTRVQDDTGLAHVFEHATMFGSEKYPSNEMYFSVNYQTYNTYMNAFTMDAVTWYPMASLSEAQLLRLADYYTDSCFRPLIMTDEGIFRTQAWHYNLPDAESELTYEGIVYSEVQGALTLDLMAMENANRVTFPGASLSYCYGGLTERIPDMTWQDVKDYHDKYYHPSNCFAILYGQIDDWAAFLALLDSYFSTYERAEISLADADYTRITEPIVSKVPYPMAEGTNTTNQSQIWYYILCPGMKGDTEQERLIDHVCMLLNQDASVLQQSMKKAFPAAAVSAGREVAAPDDAIVFVATGMNEDDAEQFKAIVDEAIRNVAENGFPQDMADSAMVTLKISTKLAPESSSPIEGVVYSFAYDYSVTGNPFDYADDIDALYHVDEENRQGLLQETCARWLSGDGLYTLTTTYPAPGEKEKKDEALKEKLAAIKASMSEEELEAIIQETNAEQQENELTAALVDQIKAVTVESLPEEVKTYPISDTTDENGIRHIEVTAGVDGISHIGIMLDATALPQEDIHWMRLYSRLLGKLDTEQHTREELDLLVSRYLYDKVTGVDVCDQKDTIHPYLVAEWKSLDEDLADGYALMEELLFHTRFDDPQRLAEEVEAQITAVRSQINQNAYLVMLQRGMADRFPFYRYYIYMNYTDYYAFLLQLKEQLAETPEEVTARFEKIKAFFNNSTGAVATFAGNAQSIALNRPLADAFMARLGHEERLPMMYDFPQPAKREAMIVDGNIQFNLLVATPDDMGLEEYDAGYTAITSLVCDQILVPVLRDQMGVYTPMSGVYDNGTMYFLTYSDPNIRETFDVYASLADQIAGIETDQETLDGYIMNAYSNLALPSGELTGAIKAIELTLQGETQEKVLTRMRQLKAVTPDMVKASAEIFRKAWENGIRSTAGSAAAINEAADLYDVILNPFNTEDTSKVEFTDAAEGSEYYEAVRFAYENGLMTPAGEDLFGTDAPATAGDFFGAMYVLVGGTPNAAEEAFAFFAQYGMVPDGYETGTELTGETDVFLFENVTAALGAPWKPETAADADERIVTRGQLASELQAFIATLQ